MNSDKAQKADLVWRDGAPVSARFDDPYYSMNDGLAEARHVFLDGNNLPEQFCEGFHIAELGFGSGLNLLAAWKMWEQTGMTSPLRFTSFEAYPMDMGEMAKALAAWPELAEYAERLLAGGLQMRTDTLELNVIIGDARATLPKWQGKADAWFLDGFSPAKNPELWSPEIIQSVAAHTAPSGTFATYTAAGHVRRALIHAGFNVTRPKGHGSKRHMSAGVLL
ncbi:MAG: tRNA (5-methylaminomethyl-2-thiouridine)(34)-methyltransferase MnmD [Paracoccaceae bacterium]|jgi:tRNA U34 5-methylaminomethyl-2-thiouridine-forming methyltransferase MnmC